MLQHEMSTGCFLLITSAILLAEGRPQETPTQDQFQFPRNYNPHPLRNGPDARRANDAKTEESYPQRYVSRQAVQTQRSNGPVVFPLSTTPPPPTPLIVTSRPLAEQIARSDQRNLILSPVPQTPAVQNRRLILNQPQNDQNQYYIETNDNRQLNLGQFQNGINSQDEFLKQMIRNGADPNLAVVYNGYLGPNGLSIVDANGNLRAVNYQNVVYNQIEPQNDYDQMQQFRLQNDFRNMARNNETLLGRNPYASVLKKIRRPLNQEQREYEEIQEHTVRPPIRKALGRYVKTKINRANKKNLIWSSQETNTVDGPVDEDYDSDTNANDDKHYAFSYAVRDQETGDDFSHSQRHSGSATNGEYRVKLPDGRVQIVSYTADNGGYKADVRYENDPQEGKPNNAGANQQNTRYQPQQQNIQYNNVNSPIANPSKLGRIVVPSREENDYPDTDYYYESINRAPAHVQTHRVTNEANELLITSKPGFLYTPTSTDSNLLYDQYTYHGRDGPKPQMYTTPSPIVYITPTTISPLRKASNDYQIYSTTTQDPQEASKTYSHYYNAESIKFVSTTPKYDIFNRNSVTAASNRIVETQRPETTSQRQTNVRIISGSSTVAPGLDNYDHLDSPDVVKIEPRPRYTARYTSIAPMLQQSAAGGTNHKQTTPTPVDEEDVVKINYSKPKSMPITESRDGQLQSGGNLRKYFAFTK